MPVALDFGVQSYTGKELKRTQEESPKIEESVKKVAAELMQSGRFAMHAWDSGNKKRRASFRIV